MPRDVTVSLGVLMNFHHDFLMAWKPVMMCVIRITINESVFRPLCSQSSQTGGTHPHSSNALLTRLASLLHHFRPNNAEATELPQSITPSVLHPRVLLGHLTSLFHRSPPQNDEANEPQQPSTPSGSDIHALFARLSSLFPGSRLDEGTEPHPPTPLSSGSDALIDILSSLFRTQRRTSEEIELPQRPIHPHVVEVPAMRDREVCLSLVYRFLVSDDFYAGLVCCSTAATTSSKHSA
jgi:hypothetical protein